MRGKGYNGSINFPKTGSEVAESSVLYAFRQKTGSNGFDLPTETEWEYACRSGGLASGFWSDGSDAGIPKTTKITTISNGVGSATAMDSIGRYQHNGGMIKTYDEETQTYTYAAAPASSDESLGTAVVGSYKPNAWGLYDMQGNVAEWTNGSWAGGFPMSTTVETVDDLGLFTDSWGQWSYRINRGGRWDNSARECAIHRRHPNLVYERMSMGVRLIWRFWIDSQAAE